MNSDRAALVAAIHEGVPEHEVALASTQGKLRLALRNPLNSERVLTKGASVGTLLSAYRPKEVAKAKVESDGTVRIEVIKGDVRKEVKF